MVRSRIRAARAAVVLVAVLALAANVGRAESLQDAWNAALTANQGLQAAHPGRPRLNATWLQHAPNAFPR